jgi:carbonic anhydrase/acetyltransferase-like protein (isoleucine patch superfamily)
MPVRLHESVFVAPSAVLSGEISIGAGASVWHHVVARAECQEIRVGRMTNIQDFAMLHVSYETPTVIGDFCSITHRATIHGCAIGDACLIGIGAVIMDGAEIGAGSIVAPGAVVREGQRFAPGSIIAGVPAKQMRERDETRANRLNAWQYWQNAEQTRRGNPRAWTGAEYDRWLAELRADIAADRDLARAPR